MVILNLSFDLGNMGQIATIVSSISIIAEIYHARQVSAKTWTMSISNILKSLGYLRMPRLEMSSTSGATCFGLVSSPRPALIASFVISIVSAFHAQLREMEIRSFMSLSTHCSFDYQYLVVKGEVNEGIIFN